MKSKAASKTLIIIKLDKLKSHVVGHVPAAEGNAKAGEMADRLCRQVSHYSSKK